VVGSKANSINPETGLMEFGFFSRIWRSFKKVVKKVIKVFKKVAPVILPIALSMTPLGPVFGAALGSGLGTLINGGSIGDALRSGPAYGRRLHAKRPRGYRQPFSPFIGSMGRG
jgi:hypothetical protein